MISQKILVLSIVAILYPVDGRIFGKECDCLARRSVYFHHKHSNSQGEQLARVLGEVSSSVTSRAIMDIITVANGHSPISSCSQSELGEMEREYEMCVKRRQYKLKCFNLSTDNQCDTLSDFIEQCTKRILGHCFGSDFSSYISHVQSWSLSLSGDLQETCFTSQSAGSPDISDFMTEAPPVLDRTKLLRRYLRHPALAN